MYHETDPLTRYLSSNNSVLSCKDGPFNLNNKNITVDQGVFHTFLLSS